jgi:outer membrane protein OmpA-like peptidoglycan-associated protein
MRVSEFDDIETQGLLSANKQRSWLLFGLIVSIALHLAVCAYFYRTQFISFSPQLKNEQTAMFKVRSIDLNSQVDKNSVDQTNPAAKPEPDKAQDQQPDQKKSFDQLLQDIQASATIPDEIDNVLAQPQAPDATALITEINRGPAQMLSNDPNGTHEQSMLNDSPVSGRPLPAMTGTELATSTTIKRPNTFTSKMPGDSAGPNKARNPGFSDLDQLLAQKGPLGSGTQLRMPDDQLFQYDSADLQPSAIGQLQKLATLIKRNPKATFTVEGYTDSFGPPEYNLDLSQRRADSVKQYLVQMMAINPGQIQTRGYGQSKFLVQPNLNVGPNQADIDAEIRRQQPNRRVVIVVHTKEG